MDYCSLRGRKITHIPATCDANLNARVHAGHLTTCIPHEDQLLYLREKDKSVKQNISLFALLMMLI